MFILVWLSFEDFQILDQEKCNQNLCKIIKYPNWISVKNIKNATTKRKSYQNCNIQNPKNVIKCSNIHPQKVKDVGSLSIPKSFNGWRSPVKQPFY